MALLLVYWPASPAVALAAIVTGIFGLRTSRQGFGGQGSALVGIAYGAISLVVLAAIVFVFYWSDF